MNKGTFQPTGPFIESLRRLQSVSDLSALRKRIQHLRKRVLRSVHRRTPTFRGGFLRTSKRFLAGELEQIEGAQTVERARYYLARLRKSLTSVKTAKVNDLNLRRWKEYGDVLTDSLWILPRRDSSGNHGAWYWGNFIPQIPHQLMMRYTKKGEWVLDPFAGSGTTLLECRRLGRNGLGVELNPSVAKKAQSLLRQSGGGNSVRTEVVVGDSTRTDFRKLLRSCGADAAHLLILHPPYHNIIRFSKNRSDLSNASSVRHFAEMFGEVVDNTLEVLQKKRFIALVIGDTYSKREWIPLGYLLMQELLKRGCLLKSIVVKNFDQTTGKRKQQALWRYRALVGGFYVFKHEYIFIFQKT